MEDSQRTSESLENRGSVNITNCQSAHTSLARESSQMTPLGRALHGPNLSGTDSMKEALGRSLQGQSRAAEERTLGPSPIHGVSRNQS